MAWHVKEVLRSIYTIDDPTLAEQIDSHKDVLAGCLVDASGVVIERRGKRNLKKLLGGKGW